MRVALAQMTGSPDKGANLERALEIVTEAARAGARLVVFPECAMAALPADQDLGSVAEPLDGQFVEGLARAARRQGLTVVAGMYESISGDGHVYNTVVVLGAEGELVGAYRKIHLYDAFGYRESDRIRAGDGSTLRFSLEGIEIGVETCYDVRFPELSRQLALEGVELILLPAAWLQGHLKEAHWEVLVRARAIENTVYVAAAGLTGRQYCANSMLVDPMGVTLVRAGEAPGLLVGEVDRERLEAVRRVNPSLANRRLDVFLSP